MADARALWERAGRFCLDEGGRFEVQGDGVLLWSGSPRTNAAPRPVGAFRIKWHWPTHDRAKIDRIEWHPALTTPDEIQRSIEVLTGLSPR
jgi:hypothetical protein